MTQVDAKIIYDQFCSQHGARSFINVRSLEDGSWLFIESEGKAPQGEFSGVIVREDNRKAFGFFGALGKVFRNFGLNQKLLGHPTSNERGLGASSLGRYQSSDHGVAIWEGGTGKLKDLNLAFPVSESLIPLGHQYCIVAFFDLRGFTSWAASNKNDVQKVIRAFEDAVQIGFPIFASPWARNFIKGTGDGVMIVSQADWYQDDDSNSPMNNLKLGHARDFLKSCHRTIAEGCKLLEEHRYPLAIGCGIASGDLDRIFLFGRLDFIGPAANEASKLQQHAWNEVCVTEEFRMHLESDGKSSSNSTRLPGKGWRLESPQNDSK
jgi:class 3 adenylate cyclase